MKAKARKPNEANSATMAVAERDRRIETQRKRLAGLRLRGDKENANASHDLVLQMMERDTIIYLYPEKF